MVETQGTPSTRRTGEPSAVLRHPRAAMLAAADTLASAEPTAPFSPPSTKSTGRRRAGGEFFSRTQLQQSVESSTAAGITDQLQPAHVSKRPRSEYGSTHFQNLKTETAVGDQEVRQLQLLLAFTIALDPAVQQVTPQHTADYVTITQGAVPTRSRCPAYPRIFRMMTCLCWTLK